MMRPCQVCGGDGTDWRQFVNSDTDKVVLIPCRGCAGWGVIPETLEERRELAGAAPAHYRSACHPGG